MGEPGGWAGGSELGAEELGRGDACARELSKGVWQAMRSGI